MIERRLRTIYHADPESSVKTYVEWLESLVLAYEEDQLNLYEVVVNPSACKADRDCPTCDGAGRVE